MSAELIPQVNNEFKYLQTITYTQDDLVSNATNTTSRIDSNKFQYLFIPDNITDLSIFMSCSSVGGAFGGDTSFGVIIDGDFFVAGNMTANNLIIGQYVLPTTDVSSLTGLVTIGPKANEYKDIFTRDASWIATPTEGQANNPRGFTPPPDEDFNFPVVTALPRKISFWVGGQMNLAANNVTAATWTFNISGISDL